MMKRTPEQPIPLQDPVVLEVAKKMNKTPAQVLLRYGIQRGMSVVGVLLIYNFWDAASAIRIWLGWDGQSQNCKGKPKMKGCLPFLSFVLYHPCNSSTPSLKHHVIVKNTLSRASIHLCKHCLIPPPQEGKGWRWKDDVWTCETLPTSTEENEGPPVAASVSDYAQVPKSVHPERIKENTDIFNWSLSEEDFKALHTRPNQVRRERM
eukprot:scaffold20608_cov19-Tisochrysis_lutea.AAC.4